MNKNDFIKNLESKDIISVIEKNGAKELVFTEVNKVERLSRRYHHNNIAFNSLSDFIESVKDGDRVIYSFKENKIFYLIMTKMELGKTSQIVHSFTPVMTEETNYWSRQSESNIKKFLNKLSVVADKDAVRDIRLMFAEFDFGVKTDAKNEAAIVKTIVNTLKKLPEVLKIRFNPYMFVDDFEIEMEIYLDWQTDDEGFKRVNWEFDSGLIKNLFYEHLSEETKLDFVVGDFVQVEEEYSQLFVERECKDEKTDEVQASIEINKK